MVDVHDGVKYVYAYSETGVLEKIDVIELRDEQEATFGTFVMTYGAYGLEKVVFNLAFSDAKAEHIYTYDKNGKLTDLTVNFDGMDDSYQYSFSDYKLCYSENPVTHERISLITRTHPETIFEFYN